MATNVTPGSPVPMNPLQRLINVFFSPKAAFADVVARPGWILPIVLLCACSVAVTFTYTQRVGWRGFAEKQLEKNSSAQQMSADQKEQAIERAAKITQISFYVIGVVGTPLFAAILAGIGLGAFNLIAGAQIKFGTAMGIVAYAWLPLFVSGLLGILVILLKQPDTVDIQNLLASNPGALLSGDAPKWLQALLGSLDLFSIWSLFLLAVGFSVANPKKIPFSRSLTTFVTLWILWILIKVGLTAAFA